MQWVPQASALGGRNVSTFNNDVGLFNDNPALLRYQHHGNIAANFAGCEHIYFGANMSFPKLDVNDAEEWHAWEGMVKFFLERDYLCTLDVDVSCVEGLIESGLTEYYNFIPFDFMLLLFF